MSEYGWLWEKVSEIRRELRERLPPGAKIGTLAEAERSVKDAGKEGELWRLLSDWRHYERHMERTDD